MENVEDVLKSGKREKISMWFLASEDYIILESLLIVGVARKRVELCSVQESDWARERRQFMTYFGDLGHM